MKSETTPVLLDKARAAEPDNSARPRRWARLWPVYAALRARGYSCQRAVQWLAKEGAVPTGEEARALNAFHILACRRNKKKKAARATTLAAAGSRARTTELQSSRAAGQQ